MLGLFTESEYVCFGSGSTSEGRKLQEMFDDCIVSESVASNVTRDGSIEKYSTKEMNLSLRIP